MATASTIPASRIRDALSALRTLIVAGCPEATFEVGPGEDPEGVYLVATVDREDLHEGADLFLDRLVARRRPPAREEAILARRQRGVLAEPERS